MQHQTQYDPQQRWPNLVSLLTIETVEKVIHGLSPAGTSSLDETERELLNTDASTLRMLRQDVNGLRRRLIIMA